MTDPTLQERLRTTTQEMASACSVPMGLWNRHSNAVLEAADALDAANEDCLRLGEEIAALRREAADAQAEVTRLRELVAHTVGRTP